MFAYYAINWLNIKWVTIHRVRCLGIVTLNVFPTSCSEKKGTKFAIPKMKLNKSKTSLLAYDL